MGLYQYSILPYINGKFLVGDHTEKFESSDAQNVIDAIREQSEFFVRKEKARELQDAFNNAIRDNKIQYLKLVNKIINELSNVNLDFLISEGIVIQKEGTLSMGGSQEKIISKGREFENEIKKIAYSINNEKSITEMSIKSAIGIINNSLNKIRGDIFENLLATLLDTSKSDIANIVNADMNEIEKLITQNITKYSDGQIKVLSQSKSSKVTGGDTKKKIDVSIDNQGITIQGGQGKTDVAINGLAGDFIGISAKNYQKNRKISLLSGANIIGLIFQWPGIGIEKQNLALNGLSAISIWESQFAIMKPIFLIQGLMGVQSEDIKSQFFIINTNAASNPILVFSIYDLLFTDNMQGDFKGSYIAATPYKDLPRDIEKFLNFINNTKITIHTQLTYSKLANLT